jgi:hypothetical protein
VGEGGVASAVGRSERRISGAIGGVALLLFVDLVDDLIHQQDQRSDFSSRTLELTLGHRDYIRSRLNPLPDRPILPRETPIANCCPNRWSRVNRTRTSELLTLAISRHSRLICRAANGTRWADLLRHSGDVHKFADFLSRIVVACADGSISLDSRPTWCPSLTSQRRDTLLSSRPLQK